MAGCGQKNVRILGEKIMDSTIGVSAVIWGFWHLGRNEMRDDERDDGDVGDCPKQATWHVLTFLRVPNLDHPDRPFHFFCFM